MLKVNSILAASRVVRPVANKQIVKKAILPTIAGVTGLSVLSGASGGPTWQFESVPPKGVEIGTEMGSVDDGLLETLSKKMDFLVENVGLTDEVDAVKDFVSNSADNAKDFLQEWGEAIADAIDTCL